MSASITLTRRFVMFAPLALAACKRGPDVLKFSGATMGTAYNVVALDPSRSAAQADVHAGIKSVLADVNRQMSNWDASSEVSRLNAIASTSPIQVSPDLAHVLKTSADIHAATDGQFDVALGPLIEAWGFGAKGATVQNPTDARIEAALASAGRAAPLVVQDGALVKSAADSQVYLSGIGKGHGVDRVASVLQSYGITDYLVEIGGDLVTSGRNADGQPWQIGIETPDVANRNVQQIVGVSGLAVATSGDYRNYFEKDGQRYTHILDATTGRPITHTTASATVLADDAMHADAWSTAMLTLGRDRGLEVAEAHDVAVLFIDRATDGSGFVTTASPAYTRLSA